ncbi:MAG: hypothetical protein EGQ38_01205 [Dialister sp.]|nr:hypothetical protein [Dialister sp.]
MTALLYLIQIYRVVDRFKGLRVSPRGVLPLNCLQKRGSGFYRFIGFRGFRGFRGGGAAQKIMKRRRVLIALRAVVISSVAERSSLQNGQHANCATSITACF